MLFNCYYLLLQCSFKVDKQFIVMNGNMILFALTCLITCLGNAHSKAIVRKAGENKEMKEMKLELKEVKLEIASISKIMQQG